MILTTPFHARTEAANRTGLWSHWAGYLAAEKYQISEKAEYFAIRNSAGIFDTSPLYKYRIEGAGAEQYLGGVLTRDIRRCPPGKGQYTLWCDDDGFVIEDGVVLRLSDDQYLLTSARPNLSYFTMLAGNLPVSITDVSAHLAALAIQGPRSSAIVSALWPEVEGLPYFGVTQASLGSESVIVSRTGYTGDLGYELWIEDRSALDLWDAVAGAAEGHGASPVGQQAVLIARVEAGLLLIDVDYVSSRFAWTATERSTPAELGLEWAVDDEGDRRFVGRDAIRSTAPRWKMVGLLIDWQEWDARHDEAGQIPPKDHRPVHADLMVYDGEGERAGWASSFLYSPMLQRHIALARVRPELSKPGSRVALEVSIDHSHHTVGAEVTPLPFYRPRHKTA